MTACMMVKKLPHPKKKDTIGCPFEDRHRPVHLVFYYGSDIISIWHMHMGMEYPSYMICFVREIPRNSWVHLCYAE